MKQDLIDRALAAGGLLGALGLLLLGPRPVTVGSDLQFRTIIGAEDVENLDCASDVGIGAAQCQFDRTGREVPGNRALRPFVTKRGAVVLLAGVFESPAVADWLARARAAGAHECADLACRAELLGQLTSVAVRIRREDSFGNVRSLHAARIESCSVREENVRCR